MTSEALRSLMLDYNLTQDCCNRQITKIHVGDISRNVCRRWKSLVAYLGMRGIVVSNIEHEPMNEEERRQNFFSQWKNDKGSEATYMVLIDALLRINCRSDAEYVCGLLQNPANTNLHEAPSTSASATATGKFCDVNSIIGRMSSGMH